MLLALLELRELAGCCSIKGAAVTLGTSSEPAVVVVSAVVVVVVARGALLLDEVEGHEDVGGCWRGLLDEADKTDTDIESPIVSVERRGQAPLGAECNGEQHRGGSASSRQTADGNWV